MGRQMHIRPKDERERLVIPSWRRSGLSTKTIMMYLDWVRRFRIHCLRLGLDETKELTLEGAAKFCSAYVGPRVKGSLAKSSQDTARNALHAWACTLQMLGEDIPPWEPMRRVKRYSPLVEEYVEFRRRHKGVSDSSLPRDADIAQRFLVHLRTRGRRTRTARVVDVDTFVATLMRRLSKRTVADLCSVLRGFLRYLRATDRIRTDLAASAVVPRVRRFERPPRALPWSDVRRLIHSIDRDGPTGKRDFAMLLLMASYGLGAAEVLGLCVKDFDWEAGVLTVRRPKTGVLITLPLLPAVAKAVADYLTAGRPRQAATRHVFLGRCIPHRPLTSGGIRHRIRLYARRVGIDADILGAHVLRHSHATRQIDQGANTKVVSDILGHRSPSSTSTYVRVALRRLRAVSLPVPR